MKRQPRQTKRELKALRSIPESELFTIAFAGRTVPVPYVASWSSEMPDLRVAPEPLINGKPALFRANGRRGEGKPVLGKMDMGRQRLCILRGLCQVCANPIVGMAWHVLLEEHALLDNGVTVRAVREPAACTACMVLSLQVCPGLRRDRPRIVWARKKVTLVTMTTPPIGGVGPLLPDGPELVNQRREDAVIGYLKVILDDLMANLSPDEFIQRFAGVHPQKETKQ